MYYKDNLLSIYPIKDKKLVKYYFGLTATYPDMGALPNFNSNNSNNENNINNAILNNYHINDSTAIFFNKFFKKKGYTNFNIRPVSFYKIKKHDNKSFEINNYDINKSILILTGHSNIGKNYLYSNSTVKYYPSEKILNFFVKYENIPKNILFYNCYGEDTMCKKLDKKIVNNRNIFCISQSVKRKKGSTINEFLNFEYPFHKIILDNNDIKSIPLGNLKLKYFFDNYLIL